MSERRARGCPACACAMEQVWADHIELDRCPECRGLWFDFYELDEVARRDIVVTPSETGSLRRCPSCQTRLGTGHIEDIAVEVCAGCSGLFLDAGEVERLACAPLADEADGEGLRCKGCGGRFAHEAMVVSLDGLYCGPCDRVVHPGSSAPPRTKSIGADLSGVRPIRAPVYVGGVGLVGLGPHRSALGVTLGMALRSLR